MEVITEEEISKRELLYRIEALHSLRKSYADLKSIQAISSNPDAYDELLDNTEAAAKAIKTGIKEVLNGQY